MRKPRRVIEELYAQSHKMQDTQEEELIKMKCEVGMWKCSGTVSRNVYWIL